MVLLHFVYGTKYFTSSHPFLSDYSQPGNDWTGKQVISDQPTNMNALKITTAWLAGSSLPYNGRFDGQKPLLGGTRNSVDQFEGQSDDQLNNQFDDLASRLSNQASIKLPGSDGWDELVAYAASPRLHPGFTVVVEVATESDIQATVS